MAKTYSEKLKELPEKSSGIYELTINGNIYIGSAVNLYVRLHKHYNDLKANRHINTHLQRAYSKYQNLDFRVIEIVEVVTDLISREQYYIDTLKPRYNIAPKAGSQLGFKHSETSKKLISEVQKGKKINPETRKRMSESQKGKKRSETHRKILSISKMGDKNPFYKSGEKHPQFGIPKSETTRSRISATSKLRGSHKGVKNPAAKSGILYDVETGANHIFLSLKPLCEKLGLVYKGMVTALHKRKFYRDRYYADYVQFPKDIIEAHKAKQ